jgi:hypothetical protein
MVRVGPNYDGVEILFIFSLRNRRTDLTYERGYVG